jgi:hypothetical protein
MAECGRYTLERTMQDMSRGGVKTGVEITLLDPDDNDLLHVFSVDPENEESLVNFLYSLIEIYGDEGEDIAAKILGGKALARAVCGALVQEGKLIRVDDEHYRLANDAGGPH